MSVPFGVWDQNATRLADAQRVSYGDPMNAESMNALAEFLLAQIARTKTLVLADCAGKQQIVEAVIRNPSEHWGPREAPEAEWTWCPKARTREFCEGTDLEWGPDAPCECDRAALLRLLAQPFADQPAYRTEWKSKP
jgi:hypothetical protein